MVALKTEGASDLASETPETQSDRSENSTSPAAFQDIPPEGEKPSPGRAIEYEDEADLPDPVTPADEERNEVRRKHLRLLKRTTWPVFEKIEEGRYLFIVPDASVSFEVGHLYRERHQLHGGLITRSEIATAKSFDGILSCDSINLSSDTGRKRLAAHLTERAGTGAEVDFLGLLFELSCRVITAEEAGEPSRLISDYPLPVLDESFQVDGFPLLSKHPLILFGDGGTVKSYLSLYFLGMLAQQGIRCALFDWEMEGGTHRERLERMFGDNMPPIHYERCVAPLVAEAPRLKRLVREKALGFALFDSIAFACDGPPESAEVVARYGQLTAP